MSARTTATKLICQLMTPLFALIGSLGSLSLQAAEQTAAEVIAPTSIAEVLKTVWVSLAEIWKGFVGHVPYLIAGLTVLIVTWLIVTLVSRFGHKLFARTTSRKSLRDLLVRLLTITVWFLGLLFSAMVIFPGLTPTKALGGLGLLSVAVGLAFKDIFENFFAGILILWRFPFEEGDFIECGDVMGKVVTVAVRNTTIRKTTGELVVVPNSLIFKNPCDVLTDQNRRRVTVMAGVAYDEDVAQSVEVITQAVNGCQTVRQDDPIEIFPQGFGDSSIDIEVTWWTGPTPLDIRKSRGEVVTAVKKALDDAGIEIPFPYRTLTFKEPLPVVNHSENSEQE